MHHPLVPACLVLTLTLACSADQEAASKAAKSAAGAIEPLTIEPGQDGSGKGGEGKLPDPRPGDLKPNPVEKTATCIVDDGDADSPGAGGEGQEETPKKPNIPKEHLDPQTPKVEGAKPQATGGGGGMARSASAAATGTGTITAEPIDYAATCRTKMADSCSTFCRERGLTWDSAASNGGTCFSLNRSATASGTLTSYQCGCMCK